MEMEVQPDRTVVVKMRTSSFGDPASKRRAMWRHSSSERRKDIEAWLYEQWPGSTMTDYQAEPETSEGAFVETVTFRAEVSSRDGATALELFRGASEALPRVLVALEVRLVETGDLTSGTARKRLRVSRRRMRAEPWRRSQEGGREALTQAIGRAAFEAGFEALIVPSAADPAGANLVVFPGRLSPGSRLTVRELPAG